MTIRDLGKGIVDIFKPDGTQVLTGSIQTILNAGSISNITGLTLPKATDPIKNGISAIVSDPLKSAPTKQKNLPALVKNPLEQFASYSVLWTVACLTPEQFNNPSSYRNSPKDLQNIVFSSGGRYDEQRVKTYFGSPEYYINNFQMNCIIGASEKSGNSNAVKFSFDIYEPHSMGLLLQSMQNSAIKAGYINYLDNAPYVLRMDIVGYNEVGQVIKSIKPKFFTLKLTSMKFTVNEGGSVYKVEGIPYNHQGFADAINTTYNDLKIFGAQKGTVEEILRSSPGSLIAVLNRNEAKLVKEGKISIPDIYDIQFPKLSSEFYSSAGNPPTTKKATAKPNEEPAKSIAGGAAPELQADLPMNEIGNASLGFDQVSGGTPLFKRAQDQYDKKTGAIVRDGMTIDPKLRAFQFSQGQSLTAMINQVILSSDYAKKAITDKNSGGFGTTPEGYFKWFKLDVQIELLKYDAVIGDYAKKITYRVVPYFIHQSIFSNPNSAPLGYSELLKKVCKEYNYIYTGQNVDVLKFDININNLFYTGTNPSPENEGAKTSNQDQKLAEKKNNTSKTGQGSAAAAQAAQAGRARPKRDPKLLAGYKGGNPEKSTEQNIAENFQQAFISGASADMVSVDLEILGDPYWLVDSGMGNYFATVSNETDLITNDGSMNYESGNVYVYLNFRTPSDINETTGLYDFSIAGKESPFGGIYRINLVENTFVDGQWKQKLKCLRMPGPQGPEEANKAEQTQPLQKSPNDNNATDVGSQEPAKASPIDDTYNATQVAGSTDTTRATAKPTTASGSANRFTRRTLPGATYNPYRNT